MGCFQGVIGGVIIALGVAGEILFSSKAANNRRDERRSQTDLKIAELNQIAEHERLARVKIERVIYRRTVSRTLDEIEAEDLKNKMTPFAGQKVTFFVAGDGTDIMEHVWFRNQLKRIVLAAGWIEEAAPDIHTKVSKGVTIFVKGDSATAGNVLVFALADLHIAAQLVFNTEEGDRPLIIFVGLL